VRSLASAAPNDAARVPAEVEASAIAPCRESEIVVASERVPKVIAAIRAAAATDKPGDGKIFVAELEGLVCIRSRESESRRCSTLARAASGCHTRTAAA
jgi:nitrogen regulatory protein PII